MAEAWLPDGRGLPDEARALVAESGQLVHLRLTAPGRYPRDACDSGLGEWWTGLAAEVTCPACLEVWVQRMTMHDAPTTSSIESTL